MKQRFEPLGTGDEEMSMGRAPLSTRFVGTLSHRLVLWNKSLSMGCGTLLSSSTATVTAAVTASK